MTSVAESKALDTSPIRVLVVDDSAVSRRLVSEAIDGDPEIVLAGTASNGRMAMRWIEQCQPDVVTLDLEMPDMGGMEALRKIRRDFPRVRVIVISAHAEQGSVETQEALALGASECISKNLPDKEGVTGAMVALRGKLRPSIRSLGRSARGLSPTASLQPLPASQPVARPPAPAKPVVTIPRRPKPGAKFGSPQVFAIGVSTGGPTALHQIAPQIPSHFPLPILVVQHMPAVFTRLLADRLQTVCALPVHEATHGMEIQAGHMYIAPGDYHMRVASTGMKAHVVLDQGPLENSCRPAVDVLFRSLAETFPGSVIAAVLTGMGQDGQLGCEALRAHGAYILAQDEATSVVWGMPGGVAKAGLADQILPLQSIIPDVLEQCNALLVAQLRLDASGARK